jgi:hypothetical protein
MTTMPAMMVTPAHIAALRAILTGDLDTFDRLAAAADFLDGEGFPILVVNALFAAAQRHFPPGWSRGDLVRFVGQLRARDEGLAEELSATAAEQMLLRALTGEPMTREFDEHTKGIAQVGLLVELVRDLDEQDLDTFLTEVHERADAWLVQHNVQ